MRPLLAPAVARVLLVSVLIVLTSCSVGRSADPTRPKDSVESQADSLRAKEDRGGRLQDKEVGSFGRPRKLPNLRDAVLVGYLDESRLVAISRENLVSAATNPDSSKLVASRVSPVVGAPLLVQLVGRSDVLVATTNQAQLIRLRGDWSNVDALDVVGAIGRENSTIRYGGLLTSEDSAFVTAAVGQELVILRVDLAKWRVTKHRFLKERFASFPQSCLLDTDTIVMASNQRVDFIDPSTLATKRSVRITGDPIGVACAEGRIWVSDLNQSHLSVLSASGKLVSRPRWQGDGSSHLFYSSRHKSTYGTDPVANVVFRCGLEDQSCSTLKVDGDKPTDLLVIGDVLVVTLENSQAIQMMDVQPLRSLGVASFPGVPRTLTYVK